MLAEFYQLLRDEFPTHGLEIVFVSSDRDASSFTNYYRTMPWLAVPFESLGVYKQLLSFQYGVAGIPFLVIIDTVSGQIVSDGRSSRQEVMQACQRGEKAIEDLLESWCNRVPPSTKEMLDLLQVSCVETKVEEIRNPKTEAYLTRAADAKTRIKNNFTLLVEEEGLSKNEAAAKAILRETAAVAPMDGFFSVQNEGTGAIEKAMEITLSSDLITVVTTALKYVENAAKKPWNPKFRQFKLSNKVADRITRVSGGLELLCSLGMQVYPTAEDFIMDVPLDVDLEELCNSLNSLAV